MAMLKVEVTAEHIAKARPLDDKFCMVGRALREMQPDADWTVGSRTAARIAYPGPRISLPDFVTAKIGDAIRGRPVEPFTFDLEVPA